MTVMCQIGESRVMKLNILSSKSMSSCPVEFSPTCLHSDSEEKGWSCLQPLFENQMLDRDRYSNVGMLSMSEESLNMCTEILGNENGTAFAEDSSLFPPSSPEISSPVSNPASLGRSTLMDYENGQHRRSFKTTAGELPPPLTSMSGSNRLRILPYREEGRLVVEACHTETAISEFEVDRSNGRVQLSIVTDSNTTNLETVFNEEMDGDRELDLPGTWSEDFEDEKSIRDFKEYHRKPCRCKDGDVDKLLVWQRFSIST